MSVGWENWLPGPVVSAINDQEQNRLKIIFEAIKDEWERNKSLDPPTRSQSTLKWISILHSSGVLQKGQQHANDMADLVLSTLLDIILNSPHDSAAQIRWTNILNKIYLKIWTKVSVTVPWRPFYEKIKAVYVEPMVAFSGATIVEGQKEHILKIVRNLRRSFPKEAAQEIWDEFRPKMSNFHSSEAMEALGWLSVLLPITHVKNGGTHWNEWLIEWMMLWGALSHNSYWDTLWMGLISRLAKLDKNGVIDWSPHIQQLFTHIQWSFQVPVGTAVAQSPIRMNLPGICRALFDSELKYGTQEVGGPRLIVVLLGRVPAKDGSGDQVMQNLQRLANLLESYYHPSNTGQWTHLLSSFLTSLKTCIVQRINAEHSPRGVNEDSYLDEEEGSNEGDDEGKSEEADVDVEDVAEGVGAAEAAERREPLSKDMQESFARVILQLASKAQYSKDRGMVKAACDAIAVMAYIIPDVVLPLVYERFLLALESVTATHQLEAAVMTLSKCVRPLLLIGSLTPLDKSIGIEQVSSGEVLADAMMALLPGLDANDERKTCAVFRFYTIVLSSIPGLKADQPGFPLPTEAWLEELLSLLFRILSNLEAPEARSEHGSHGGASFLLDSSSMYRPMMDLLFERLSPELRSFAIRKVGQFLATTSLPSMTAEASVLAQAAAYSDAEAAAQHIVEPVLGQIEAELPGLLHLPSGQLSKVQEASLKWKVTILQYTVVQLRAALIPYKARFMKVVSALFAAPSKNVHKEARNLLSVTLNGLTNFKCMDQYAPSAPEQLQGSAEDTLQIEAWLTPRFADLDASVKLPQWYLPSESEVAFAEKLVTQHLVRAAEELIAVSAGNGTAKHNGMNQKNQYFSLLYRIIACLEGLQSCLPDFVPTAASVSSPGTSLVAAGQAGACVGKAEYRELLAKAVLAAWHSAGAQDPEVLQLIISVGSSLLLAGVTEFTASKQTGKTQSDDEVAVVEPALANLLRSKQEGVVWRRRRPRWLAIEKVNVQNLWRASQNSFRWWASTERTEATLDMISSSYKAVFVELLLHSVHTYRGVRDSAVQAVSLALKRYPCLTMPCLPFLLGGLANLPRPSSDSLLASMNGSSADGEAALEGTLDTLLTRQVDTSLSNDFNASAAEVAEQEALVAGVSKLLSGQPFYRISARSPLALAALTTALLGSAGHQGPRAAEYIAHMFITFSVGFIRPPALSYAQLEQGKLPEPISRVVSQLLEVLSSQQPRLHWRYELMASAILMFLLPPVDAPTAKRVAEVYLDMLVGQLQSLRSMAATAILFMLGWKGLTPVQKGAAFEAVHDVLASRQDFGKVLLAQLTHSHPAGGHAEESKGGTAAFVAKFMAMSMDEKAAQLISRSVEGRLLMWPDRKSSTSQDSNFDPMHAHLIARLAVAAPAEMLASLKGPLQEALQGVQQDLDRPRTSVSAEALSGLLACSATYDSTDGGESAWSKWVRPLLVGALAAAPLEFGDLWSGALRYPLYSLAKETDPSLGLLLEVITEPLPEGANSAAVMKRLKNVGQALTELTQRGLVGAPSVAADGKLGGVAGAPGQQVSASVSGALGGTVGGVMGVPGSNIAAGQDVVNGGTGTSVRLLGAVRKFQWAVLRELPALVMQPGEAVRSHVASVIAIYASGILCGTSEAGASSTPMDIDSADSSLHAAFVDFLDSLKAGMEEGTAVILAAADSKEPGGSEAAAALMHDRRVTRAWCALQFVSQALKTSDGAIGPFLAPHLLAFLPCLLKLQEVPQPELQPLSSGAKGAVALLKYLPLPAELLPRTTAILTEGVRASLWPTRAAALVYAQYFWFRHFFLLSEEDRSTIQTISMQLLADKKLEVQDLAKSTLAGLIKGLPEDAARALRENFLAKADAMFPVRARGRRVAAASAAGLGGGLEAPVAEKHATVLGLSAFVLASPYDVPEWLPELLLALVRAASQPAPIKTSVRKALAEFRRTHEEVALAEAKRALQPDQWDALQSVASPATYFA